MDGWFIFWMANFALAGSAFAVITLIVLVRGTRDLREMFAGLRSARPGTRAGIDPSGTGRGPARTPVERPQ